MMNARLTIRTSTPVRVTKVTRLNTDSTFTGPVVGDTIEESADFVMSNKQILPHGVGVEVQVVGVTYPACRAEIHFDIPAVGTHTLSTGGVSGFNQIASGVAGADHYFISLIY